MGISVWFLSALLPLSAAGARASGSHAAVLHAAVNGKTVVYRPGRKFALVLDVLASAGYQWDCRISDSSIVVNDSTPEVRPARRRAIVGGTSVETFHFRAVREGTCVIRLTQQRSWLKDAPPHKTVTFTVRVKA